MVDTVQTAIYKLGVDPAAYVQGMQAKVAADQRAMASGEGVVVVEEKVERATRATVSSLEKRLARLDPMIAAQQRYQAALGMAQRFEDEGIGTAAQRARLLDLETQKYQEQVAAVERLGVAYGVQAAGLARSTAALVTHAGAVKLNQFQMQNLAFQMNDIGTMLASGQAPFVMLMQQGMQISQVFGANVGVGAALKATGTALWSFVTNPLNLAVLGIASAAGAVSFLFNVIGSGSGSVEDDLKTHEELIKRIRDAYGDAGKAATDYVNREQQALKDQLDTDNNRKRLADDLSSALSGIKNQILGIGYAGQLSSVFGDLADQAMEFAKAISAGSADVEAYYTNLLRTANDPTISAGLRENAQALLDMASAANKLAIELHSAAGAAAVVANIHFATPEQLGAATQTLRFGLAGSPATTDFGGRFDPIGEKAKEDAKANKGSLSDAASMRKQFDDALKATEKQTDALHAQGEAFGQTAGAAAELQKRQELLNLAEANHIKLSPADIALINEKAAAYGRATDALEAMRDRQEAVNFIAHSLYDAAKGADSFADAVGRLAGKLADAVEQAFFLGEGPLAGIFGMKGSGGFLGKAIGGIAGLFGAGAPATGFLFHSGGVVGDAGASRLIHPSYFDDAPRYHGGGIAGLLPDEVPAILQRGERVVPRGASADVGNVVTINITTEGSSGDPAADRRHAKQIADMVRATVKDQLGKERKSGGILNPFS